MDYRLYFATHYDVKFSGGYFNGQPDDATQLLSELGLVACDDSGTVFEVEKEVFKEKVDALRPEYTAKADLPHPLLRNCTYAAVLAILDEIITGTIDDCIHLEWF